MGQSAYSLLCKKKNVRILINGLDAAGKTTVLYRMKMGEIVTTIPTIGFNVETVNYKNLHLTVWDVGGRDKMRPLLRHYYPGTDALIFVVDSGDRERLSYVTEELHNILREDELEGVPVAIMANKQDLANCMTVEEISKALRISDEQKRRDITAFATCAASGDGLSETLEWLDDQLAAKQAKHAVIKPIINAVPSSVARFSGSVSEAVKDTFAYMMAWFSARPQTKDYST